MLFNPNPVGHGKERTPVQCLILKQPPLQKEEQQVPPEVWGGVENWFNAWGSIPEHRCPFGTILNQTNQKRTAMIPVLRNAPHFAPPCPPPVDPRPRLLRPHLPRLPRTARHCSLKEPRCGLYCGWTKCCTSWEVDFPSIYRDSFIPTDAGFCPSTMLWPESLKWRVVGYCETK